MYGNENPAEVVALLEASPYKYYVHINDNDGKWDWDYFCGTKHFLEYVEFLSLPEEIRLQRLLHLGHLADALGYSRHLRGQQPA